MKKVILSAAFLTLSVAMFAQSKLAEVAKFSSETIDQGKLKQNNPEEVKFIVTNISKAPLIIEQASPTCGCTIGDYTKAPIAPGATGYVSAKFNAANPGHFDKHLTVKFAGVPETQTITITGDVLVADEYDKWVLANPKKKVETPTAIPSGKTVKSSKVKTAKVSKKAA